MTRQTETHTQTEGHSIYRASTASCGKNPFVKFMWSCGIDMHVDRLSYFVSSGIGWQLGVVVSVVGRINEVNQHRARLVR